MLCKLFGQHGIQISNHEHLTGKFNKHLLDCTLLFADEAFWPGDRSAEGTLKRIITEDTLPIEPKGIDLRWCRNRLHIILASNNDWVVPAAINARRFAVFNVSDRYRKDRSYFRPLYDEIANGGAAAMLYDLLRVDLGDWHPRDDVPATDALTDQKELSLKADEQWWFQLLKNGLLPKRPSDTGFPLRARSRDLINHARKTVPGLRNYSEHMIGKTLAKHGCRACVLKGRNAWEFPSLKDAREAWDGMLPGTKWKEWNDLAEWGEDDPYYYDDPNAL